MQIKTTTSPNKNKTSSQEGYVLHAIMHFERALRRHGVNVFKRNRNQELFTRTSRSDHSNNAHVKQNVKQNRTKKRRKHVTQSTKSNNDMNFYVDNKYAVYTTCTGLD